MPTTNPRRPSSDPTANCSRFFETQPHSARHARRSNPPTPHSVERYLREEDRLQAFFGQQTPSSPSRTQMQSHSQSCYGPQAPSYHTVSDPYQAFSRSQGRSNSQVAAIPEHPPLDNGWPLPEYATQYQIPTPTYHGSSPPATHYTHSQSSQAPPPYESHSHRRSGPFHGFLDDPYRPPPYEVSMRSREMSQYPNEWDREWQRTQQPQEGSSSDNERRHSHAERRRDANERRSSNGDRRRRTD